MKGMEFDVIAVLYISYRLIDAFVFNIFIIVQIENKFCQIISYSVSLKKNVILLERKIIMRQ